MGDRVVEYDIRHVTAYHYEEVASLAYNEAHLLPRPLATFLYKQVVVDAGLLADPAWNDSRERTDFFGNRAVYFTIRQPHASTVITAGSRVTIEPRVAAHSQNGDARPRLAAQWLRENAAASASWESIVGEMRETRTDEDWDVQQFCLPSPLIPHLAPLEELARCHFAPRRPVVEAALSLMDGIYRGFAFMPDATDIATPLGDVLRDRKGVCQDFAHVMIGALRSLGLAARYMSGYIETSPPPGGIKLEGVDASHAWCALYVPEFGWLDFDPTNALLPSNQHVVLAWGRDYGDVSPLKGVFYGGNQHEVTVSVDMKRNG